MDVDEGFILGVYNYCDRWCERCPFTGRCRVFADGAEHAFEEDHGPLTEPMADRQAAKLAGLAERWEKRFGIDLAKIEEEALKTPYEPPDIRLEHLELDARAQDFTRHLWSWLDGRASGDPTAHDALEVLQHFSYFVAAKIHRALSGLADDDEFGDDEHYDSNGSAKAALTGLDRMRQAWTTLIERGYAAAADIQSLVDDTTWLIEHTEKHLPEARAFVRPAFDEPDEVRKLEAAEAQEGRR